MKTIFKNDVYDRVDDETATIKVRSGWKFVPKSEWKKNDRDFGKEERIEREKAKRAESCKREVKK